MDLYSSEYKYIFIYILQKIFHILMSILVQKIRQDSLNLFYFLNKIDICVTVSLYIHIKLYIQKNKLINEFSGKNFIKS